MGAYIKRYHPYAKAAYGAYRTLASIKKNIRSKKQYSQKRKNSNASSTKAVTKKRKYGPKAPNEITSAGFITQSYSRLHYKPMKGYNIKNLAKNIYRFNGSSSHSSDYGKQGVQTEHRTGYSSYWGDCYDSSQKTTTNQENLNPLGATTSDRKLWVDYTSLTYHLTNQSPNLVEMDVYDVLCKTDKCDGPKVAWAFGLVDAQGSSTGIPDQTYPGSYPSQSAIFRRDWKIVKKTRVQMASGANHRHVFRHNINGVVNLGATEAYATQSNLKGYTTATFFVTRGMPADTQNNFLFGQITLDRTKVICCWDMECQYRVMDSKPRKIQYTNSYPEPTTGGVFAQNNNGVGVNDSLANTVDQTTAFS